ncbi:iron-containing alcohol dehydrogenase [Pirellulaceae bacterium SH467]|jgi:alcohol dehydrogenase
MQAFDYQLRPRILFGANSIDQLGVLAKDMDSTKVLLVSDPGVVQAGIFDRGRESLQNADLQVVGFHDFTENPSTRHVDEGVRVAKSFRPDLIVGLGGGSSMDCAKGINFIYSCGGRIHDYWGVGKATGPLLPMIAIPTTAGTGSETQSFALISDPETHVKMACGDPRAACRIAMLDPVLTLTQPARVTALTGIDALTHALETFVCNRRNPMSECYSLEAWRRLTAGFSRVIHHPMDLQARGDMLLGAAFAGMAIEASMLGAAHALANPLTANLGTPHGQAVGLMMPHVIRFNSSVVGDRYETLMKNASTPGSQAIPAAEQLAVQMTNWLSEAGLATTLSQLDGWPSDNNQAESLVQMLAAGAIKQWTAGFNPRSVTEADMFDLYQRALS